MRVGVVEDWPPEYVQGPSGGPGGFAVEVLEAVARRAGVRPEYRVYPSFPHLLEAVGRGEIGLVPSLGDLEGRREDLGLRYTRPHSTHPIRVFVREGTPGVQSLDDLEGQRVGVVEANVGVSIAAERPGLDAVVLSDVRNGIFQLLSGEIDGLIYPEPTVLHLARNANLAGDLRAVGDPLREVRRGIAVAPGVEPGLLARLDSAVAELVGSEEYEEIYERWHADPTPFWTGRRIATLAGGLLILVVVGMGLWRHVTVLRLNRRLRREETRFRSLVEGLGEGIMIADLEEGRIQYVNRRCARILGYEADELVGMPVEFLVRTDDRENDSVRERLRARSRGESESYEVQLEHRDGTTVWVEVHASPYRIDGEVVGSLAALSDVTARKEAEEALRVREEQLRQAQKMEAVGRLAGGVAHDFNNLLTVIRAHSDFALLDLDPSDPLAEEIDAIQDAADRAARLTNQLLAFGREQLLRPRVVDLNEVVWDVHRLLRRVIGEDIRMDVRLADDLPPVRVDPSQIEQVLVNLAVNARDAMPDGGVLTLKTAAEEIEVGDAEERPDLQPGRYVRLDVSDTGVGMEPDTVERIFEPFFTTKDKDEGTGLGLAMAYGIVRQSDGSLEVESEPGRGSTFTVHLPVTDEEVKEAPADETSLEGADGKPASGRRVLVVEDDASVRRIIRRLLERSDLLVDAVPTAEEGLERLEGSESPPDLVLTDLVLPGMSGRDLVERLRRQRPDLPLVVMSGYAEGSPGRRGDLPGEVGFIQKPFTPEALMEEVRAALVRS